MPRVMVDPRCVIPFLTFFGCVMQYFFNKRIKIQNFLMNKLTMHAIKKQYDIVTLCFSPNYEFILSWLE